MASNTSTKRGPTYGLSPALSATTTNSVSPALSAFDPVTSGLSSANTTVPSSPGKEKTDPFALTGPAIELDLKDDLKELERRVRDGQGRKVETWGHRGASAAFPENTLASFAKACEDGADGIETDIHMTRDDRLVMFHDPELSRTTDGKGKIHALPWEGVIEHVRTVAEPHQPIPLFSDVLDLLMQPANIHVKLNIDCKVENDPHRLFPMIRDELSKFEHWQTLLAPRLILGIWHPKFIKPAQTHLPFLPRYAICMSVPTVREYFFTQCDGFSMYFPTLLSTEGEGFRRECAMRGKKITVWTVNKESEMKECLRWGVQAVITDKPDVTVGLVKQVERDPTALLSSYLEQLVLPWTSLKYYSFAHRHEAKKEHDYLEREGGAFDSAESVERVPALSA